MLRSWVVFLKRASGGGRGAELSHGSSLAMNVPTNSPAAGMAEQGTNLLRDIKPPVQIPGGWEWVWWGLGVLALAWLLYWALRYWQKRRAAAPPVMLVPAHVRAKQKLQDALALLDRPKEFCIAVSDTVRWYLEERFDFHAPERTTEEFLRELGGSSLLSSQQKDSLGQFLEKCDLVKFAKYEPAEPELRDLHGAALRLVEETTPASEASPRADAAVTGTVPVTPAGSVGERARQ
jgi:hypothetical protein